MTLALDENVVVSFETTSVNETSSRRRRLITWCLLSCSVFALLTACPAALKARLVSDVSETGKPPLQTASAYGGSLAAYVHAPANTFESTSRSASVLSLNALRTYAHRAPTLAIIADYDGCWDIISPTNPRATHRMLPEKERRAARRLLRALNNISAGREEIIFFVGSARQGHRIDRYIAGKNGNGVALGRYGAFEKWEAKFKHKGWTLNKALLSDGNEPFSAWNDPKKTFSWDPAEEIKVKLVENNLRYLEGLGPVDVYFFDDIDLILNHVHRFVEVPPNVNLYTVHYSPYSARVGTTNASPIMAKDVNGSTWQIS
eukprot:TRINITY_DN28923_c0_g1_i1.p1 TRINITY_DN28923_c0_g1~~TRINITY_DN28923_c0_g1_i1.p1  ORF type:complete len:317 (-),score=30.37 TRINITY_DN28923_c0_g1_i1:273-1223(-)